MHDSNPRKSNCVVASSSAFTAWIGIPYSPEAPAKLTLSRAISTTFVRALSFSDDSINVEPSTQPSNGPVLFNDPGRNSQRSQPRNVDVFSKLISFRRTQSCCYQSLFGSSREELERPWQARYQTIDELNGLFNTVCGSLPEPLANVVGSELSYLCILIIQPPSSHPTRCHYGIALLFDYMIRYAQSTWLMCRPKGPSHCTTLDLNRASFVGQRLLEIVLDPLGALFEDIQPQPPTSSSDYLPPPLPSRTSVETATKAIDAVTQMDSVLDILGRRFGYPSSSTAFKRDSTIAMQTLYARRQYQRPYRPMTAGNLQQADGQSHSGFSQWNSHQNDPMY